MPNNETSFQSGSCETCPLSSDLLFAREVALDNKSHFLSVDDQGAKIKELNISISILEGLVYPADYNCTTVRASNGLSSSVCTKANRFKFVTAALFDKPKININPNGSGEGPTGEYL